MIYRDDIPRIVKIGDALSQLGNVALSIDHKSTNANESISGRAYRQKQRKRRFIDALFFWQRNPGHCERAYLGDLERAKLYIKQHAERE
jgi:hypothetical protein